MKSSAEIKRKFTALVIGVVTATGGVACNQSRVVPKISGRYIKAMYSVPLTLDPAQMNDTASLVASNLIYSGLLSFTSNLELRGSLAESWETSRDGKTLTFNLRRDAKFHDGTPITAGDAVRSFERVVGPKSKVYSYYDCIVGAEGYHSGRTTRVSGIRAVGDTKLEIELQYPFPPFLSVLAGATAKILPKGVDEAGYFNRPVGSGPFRFEKIEKADKHTDFILERSEEYFGERPKISVLVLRAMDESEALKQAAAGVVHDLANYPLTGKEDIFKIGSHVLAPVAATWIIGLNARLSPFNDLEIRRAFKKSVDTEAFRKEFHPDALVANGYVPPGIPGFQHSYLADDDQKEAVRRSKKLIRVAIPEVLARSREMKSFFERGLRAKGWNVEIIPMKWDELMKGYSNKTLQAFLVSMNMDYPDTEFLVRNFKSSNPDNFSGLKDKAVDALINKARATQDRVIRQNLYADLVSLLSKSAVTVDLFHPRGHYWVNDCVRGFEPNLLADVYIDYRAVSLAEDCISKSVAAL